MKVTKIIKTWIWLSFVWALFPFLATSAMAQDAEPDLVSYNDATIPSLGQVSWVDDAIKMVEFIETHKLILQDDSYDEYEKLVLNAPSDEKLNRLYELLIDAIFAESKDVIDKYMPIYMEEIEKTGSVEHQDTLEVLNIASKGLTSGKYEAAIDALERIAYDENTHTFTRVRALAITGFLYGYLGNADHIIITLQNMEAIARNAPSHFITKKEIIRLKALLASHTNDPEEKVKYSSELLMLNYQNKYLILGNVTSENFTHLVMENGDLAAIDKIDALNQRVAHMTGNNTAIFRAYMKCGEFAVKLERNAKGLQCFDKGENYIDEISKSQIPYYLYSAIAYARDGQTEKARRNLEIAKNIPDAKTSVRFRENIELATSEVLQAEGQYVEAYNGLRSHFIDRALSHKKELGEVTTSLRVYSQEKANLLEERAEVLESKKALQDRVISRQSILIFLSALIAVILLGFLQAQRLNTKKLRQAREKTIEANRAIKSEARTDQLTRIGNRRAFYEYCAALSINPQHRDFTLAILDLDGFKQINDTYGHELGDLMIQETSRRLSTSLNGIGRVFRLGGDEFSIIFLPEGDRNLRSFKDCITNALKGPVKNNSKSFDLNWSVGAVNIKGENQNPLKFLYQADYALYQAKEKVGPSFHIFSEVDFEDVNREIRLSEDVLWNLETSSFIMFGQTVVNTANGTYRPFGVEALVRAQTRAGDVISPEAFIRHVHSSGKTSLFTKLSLLKSIEMLETSDLDCPLLFNLSRQQITDVNVLNIVTETLEARNFPANKLIIELSECTLNQDLSSASETLYQFKRIGIRIALDDFGSANTGFSSLLKLDVDLIKTDRNFLNSAMSSTRTKHLMSNVIALSKKLDIHCIIEGVETPAEVSFAKSIGGQMMQGYIFGRPEETPKFRTHSHRVEPAAQDNAVQIMSEQKSIRG